MNIENFSITAFILKLYEILNKEVLIITINFYDNYIIK